MANQVYTLSQLQTAATHALAGAPDSNLSPTEVVNDAIQYLASKHAWRWRQRALTIDSVNGQNYVNLPADFDGLETVKLASGGDVQPVTLDVITQYRASGAAPPNGGVYYCLNYKPQSSGTVEPTPVLELFPTPGSTTTGYLVGIYFRTIPYLSTGGNLPDIPGAYHVLIKAAVRAMAVAQEEQQFAADWSLFNALLPDFIAKDSAGMGNLGPSRGGLDGRRFSGGPTQGAIQA